MRVLTLPAGGRDEKKAKWKKGKEENEGKKGKKMVGGAERKGPPDKRRERDI
jgi:hypothetical protein